MMLNIMLALPVEAGKAMTGGDSFAGVFHISHIEIARLTKHGY